MAANAQSVVTELDQDVPLELIVFSCGICQATIPEIYATEESNRGFDSGSSGEERAVTRLWISECSHIFCGKHLPDGGPPFHPKDTQPRAPCPQCQEKGNGSLQNLYGIRGLGKGELPDIVPSSWTQCPAIKLDSSIPGMEALRFQYLCLSRYAQRAARHWKSAERKRHALEAAYSKERKQRRQAQQQIFDLQARIEELEKNDAKLQKWEARKPAINHYLSIVTEMSKELETLRWHLAQHGYEVPVRSYAFQGGTEASSQSAPQASEPLEGKGNATGAPNDDFRAGKHMLTLVAQPIGIGSSSSRKRKLVGDEAAAVQSEYLDCHDDRIHRKLAISAPIGHARKSSRELMPPPIPRANAHGRNNTVTPTSIKGAALAQRRMPAQAHIYENRMRTSSALCRNSATESRSLQFRARQSLQRESDMPRSRLWRAQHIGSSSPAHLDQRHAPRWPGDGGIQHTRSPHFEDARRSNQSYQRFNVDDVQPRSFSTQQRATNTSSSVRWQTPDVLGVNSGTTTRNVQQCFNGLPSTRSSLNRESVYTEVYQHPYQDERGFIERHGQESAHLGLNFKESALRGEAHPRLHQKVFYHPRAPSRGYDTHKVPNLGRLPQTPGNRHGPFEWPIKPAESAPNLYLSQNRVTLPPDLGRARRILVDHEPALSQIRGVRGADSQICGYSNRQVRPLHDDFRTPFSAAGGRRSVRR